MFATHVSYIMVYVTVNGQTPLQHLPTDGGDVEEGDALKLCETPLAVTAAIRPVHIG